MDHTYPTPFKRVAAMRRNTFPALVVLLLATTSCVSLTARERMKLDHLNSYGIGSESQGKKNPAIAAALNLLPGFGNFYLALDTNDDSMQWAAGLFNLLFWPASVVWGVPEGLIDGTRINKKATLAYYDSPRGRAEFRELQRQVPTDLGEAPLSGFPSRGGYPGSIRE